jgi:hypothetical protein
VEVVARQHKLRSELIVRRSSSDEARWTSATHSGAWRVVTPDNTSWPTRGRTSMRRLAQPCEAGAPSGRKAPVTEAIRRSSSPGVVVPDSACHAGGRGFESRRSRKVPANRHFPVARLGATTAGFVSSRARPAPEIAAQSRLKPVIPAGKTTGHIAGRPPEAGCRSCALAAVSSNEASA